VVGLFYYVRLIFRPFVIFFCIYFALGIDKYKKGCIFEPSITAKITFTMIAKQFKTTGSTSIHGEFEVVITIFHNEYMNMIDDSATKAVATIGGQDFNMEWNSSTCPDDRIFAGVKFANQVGCAIGQSIRCNATEVADFCNKIKINAARERQQGNREWEISQRNHNL
jgi:hypothetical protein